MITKNVTTTQKAVDQFVSHQLQLPPHCAPGYLPSLEASVRQAVTRLAPGAFKQLVILGRADIALDEALLSPDHLEDPTDEEEPVREQWASFLLALSAAGRPVESDTQQTRILESPGFRPDSFPLYEAEISEMLKRVGNALEPDLVLFDPSVPTIVSLVRRVFSRCGRSLLPVGVSVSGTQILGNAIPFPRGTGRRALPVGAVPPSLVEVASGFEGGLRDE